MILTEPKNQVIHRKNSRKLSNKEQKPVPTSAKAKRKPRQPKESKQPQESKRKSAVITVDVGHTEYFDPKTPTPPSDDLPETEQPPLEALGPPPALVRQQSTVGAKPKP